MTDHEYFEYCTKCGSEFPENPEVKVMDFDDLPYNYIECQDCGHKEVI